MRNLWDGLPVLAQEVLILLAWLAPLVVLGVVLLRGLAPGLLVRALIRRFSGPVAVFVLLIAASVATSVSLGALERGLRAGTARAADKFDIVIAAPGSDITLLMATVFLQPSDVALMGGETYARIADHPAVDMAAPLAFGDSAEGHPVVGTIGAFVTHLSDGRIEGRLWQDHGEAVVGSDTPFAPGDEIEPAHGLGEAADADAHAEHHYVVTGRMARTGSPWDRAVIVPIEAVWETHGLATGHAPPDDEALGPPFDAAYFPGTPAVVVRSDSLAGAYGLRSAFQGTEDTTAFFPGAVLSRLYGVLGDIRQAVSLLALVTQVLVAAAVLTGFVLLARLIRRQMALLQALGAPRRFIVAVIWSLAVTLIGTGALFGLGLGYLLAGGLSRLVTAQTQVAVSAQPGWSELHLIAAFVTLSALVALLPALLQRRDLASDLRA